MYNKLEEAARLALEQEAAAKSAEERKKAEEATAKAAAEAEEAQGHQNAAAEGNSKPEGSVVEEEGSNTSAPAETEQKDYELPDYSEK